MIFYVQKMCLSINLFTCFVDSTNEENNLADKGHFFVMNAHMFCSLGGLMTRLEKWTLSLMLPRLPRDSMLIGCERLLSFIGDL